MSIKDEYKQAWQIVRTIARKHGTCTEFWRVFHSLYKDDQLKEMLPVAQALLLQLNKRNNYQHTEALGRIAWRNQVRANKFFAFRSIAIAKKKKGYKAEPDLYKKTKTIFTAELFPDGLTERAVATSNRLIEENQQLRLLVLDLKKQIEELTERIDGLNNEREQEFNFRLWKS